MLLEKKHKISKMIKDNYSTVKSYRKPNIVDIRSVIIEHPKTSQKLSNTLKHAKTVPHVGSGKSSNSLLYNKTKKRENILN